MLFILGLSLGLSLIKMWNIFYITYLSSRTELFLYLPAQTSEVSETSEVFVSI